jgi:frataxin-like iron-binding protein CyaY
MPAAEYHRLADRALDELLAALDDVEAALPDADITSSVSSSFSYVSPLSIA